MQRVDARGGMNGSRLVSTPLVAAGSFLGVVTAYLLTLLGAAALGRRRFPPGATGGKTSFVVLVPARDEERVLNATLRSIERLDYQRDRFEVFVIAHNCSDETAAVAARAGATVYERQDPSQPGKGKALAWALDRVWEDRPHVDAVVMVDADCHVSPNLLTAIEQRLLDGAAAVQTNYVVSNPLASPSAALRFAAFALISTVRPLGKSTLGLSCGLLGTGMAFSRETVERVPWRSFSLAEDAEQHMRLVEAGARVVFAPEASVSSAMPTSLWRAREQQLRWESGRWMLLRRWTPKLVTDGLRRRDVARLHAGLEMLVPPQSLLFAGNGALAVAGALLESRPARRIAAVNLLGQLSFVVGGLFAVRAPAAVYGAIAWAPVFILLKLATYARVVAGRGPRTWVRTEREP